MEKLADARKGGFEARELGAIAIEVAEARMEFRDLYANWRITCSSG